LRRNYYQSNNTIILIKHPLSLKNIMYILPHTFYTWATFTKSQPSFKQYDFNLYDLGELQVAMALRCECF
jgi:hypothetical protein